MGALTLLRGGNAIAHGIFSAAATLHHVARMPYDPRVGAPEIVTDYSCNIVERPATYGRTEQGDEWIPFDEGLTEKRRWGLIDAQSLAVEPMVGDRLTAWGKTWNLIGVTRIGTENGVVSWGLNLEI